MRSPFLLLACAALVGCAESALPGQYFDVTVQMVADACNEPSVAYSESFQYRLERYEGTTDVDVAVGRDVFGTGSVSGCVVTYDSVVWTQERDAGDIRWMLTGQAEVQPGDGACGNADDWVGTETYRVLSSEDQSVEPGCEYTLDVRGSFIEEIDPE